MITAEFNNFRATAQVVKRKTGDVCLVNVHRISDGHFLWPQMWFATEPDANELSAILYEWVMRKAGAEEPPKVHCTACGVELVSVHSDTDYQFCNALWIEFTGGYSMFIDTIGAEKPRAVVCHDCAHALCKQHRWIAELLKPESGHAHLPEDHDRLRSEGHVGWDLE